ncbi:hypothetical protein ACFC7P_12485 [Enterococcus faecalis]|uniref:hypothetical protein n=1 Tax=Enterococcus faecalis TaxID=1351 RepID=UPI0035DB1C21
MKPTKARLKAYVNELRDSVVIEIRVKKKKAVLAHIEKEWLKIDPEFKKLRSYFESLGASKRLKNELVDLLEENNLVIWSFYRATGSTNLNADKEKFFGKICRTSVKGLAKIEDAYDQEIEEVEETYSAIVANVGRVPAKQGLAYLEELGFDVSIFKEEEAQLPMITVDKSKLRLPSETTDSK